MFEGGRKMRPTFAVLVKTQLGELWNGDLERAADPVQSGGACPMRRIVYSPEQVAAKRVVALFDSTTWITNNLWNNMEITNRCKKCR